MSIKNRLYMSAGIAIVLIVILLSVVLVTSDRIAETNKEHQLLMDVYESTSELDIVTYDYLLHHERRMEYQWNMKYDSLGEILGGLEEEELISIRVDYVTLGNFFSRITANYEERQRLIQEGAYQERIDASTRLEERLTAQLLITSQSLTTDTSRLADAAHIEATEAQRVTSNLTVILMIVLVIAITASSLLIARSISKPLTRLADYSRRVGKGEYAVDIEIKGKDEVASVASDVKSMVGQLQQHHEHLEELVEERTSNLKARTTELEWANIRIQEMDRLKSIFLASMSHELRTPLNSIIGFTGIILQGMSGEISEEQRKQLTMVKNSASHLLGLINDVLDISKIEAGKVELSLEEFSLDDLVREVVETLSPTANEKGLELMTEVPDGITLTSDRRRIKQVLMNLMSNAVKFTDQGSVKITTRVIRDDNLEIGVIDMGVGIKKKDINKLFEPFQQIDISLAKKHEGTGLGLYLAKKLLALLGGDISVKSEYGKGSEFTFTIPLQYEEEK